MVRLWWLLQRWCNIISVMGHVHPIMHMPTQRVLCCWNRIIYIRFQTGFRNITKFDKNRKSNDAKFDVSIFPTYKCVSSFEAGNCVSNFCFKCMKSRTSARYILLWPKSRPPVHVTIKALPLPATHTHTSYLTITQKTRDVQPMLN